MELKRITPMKREKMSLCHKGTRHSLSPVQAVSEKTVLEHPDVASSSSVLHLKSFLSLVPRLDLLPSRLSSS